MKTVYGIIVLALLASFSNAVIIDHEDIPAVASLDQQTMDNIGQQRWLFTHASVGGNMINGMNSLRSSDSSHYQLIPVSSTTTSPPSTGLAGRVYECQRGNPGWVEKFNIFNNCIRNYGWANGKVDIAMDKLCYIDTAANATTYTNMMSQLEADYPDIIFVYCTMPIKTSVSVSARNYNAAVRAFCTGNDRILYDIADIEAHDPSGTLYTSNYGGIDYPVLYSGYTTDGGHLNSTGSMQVARGWYAVAAYIDQNIINQRIPGDCEGDGDVDILDFLILKANFGTKTGATWNMGDFDSDGDVDIFDFLIMKANFGR